MGIGDVPDREGWVAFVSDFIGFLGFTWASVEDIGQVDDECGGDACVGIGMDDAWRDDDDCRGLDFESHADLERA